MNQSSDNLHDATQSIRVELLKKMLPELERARKLVADLEAAVAKIEGDYDQDDSVLKSKTGQEVAIEFLTKVGEPKPVEEVIDAIIEAGVMLGKTRPRVQAGKSIKWAVTAERLTEKNGMIGLPEWESK